MNILFLADIVPYPPNTGIKIRTYNILKELCHDGANRVFLVCFHHKSLIPDDAILTHCVSRLRETATEVHVLEIPSDNDRLSYLMCLGKALVHPLPYRCLRYYTEPCLQVIAGIMNRVRIDLVHLDKTEFFNYKRAFGAAPIVCTNHNVESDLLLQRSRYEINLMRRFFAYVQYLKTKKFEKLALSNADGYVTCTDLDAAYFREQYGLSRLHATIENGVDTRHYGPWSGTVSDYLLIIGAQNKESTANFDATHFFFREVWPLIRRESPQLRVKIVGRNPDPSVLMLRENDPGIEILGFVDDERQIIGGALALAVPLRVGGGSRLKILTAMSMGTPVVSTSIGAQGICCETGRDILIADTPRDFARALLSFAVNTKLRSAIGSGGRGLVERQYNWERIGVKLRAFYQKVMTEHDRANPSLRSR